MVHLLQAFHLHGCLGRAAGCLWDRLNAHEHAGQPWNCKFSCTGEEASCPRQSHSCRPPILKSWGLIGPVEVPFHELNRQREFFSMRQREEWVILCLFWFGEYWLFCVAGHSLFCLVPFLGWRIKCPTFTSPIYFNYFLYLLFLFLVHYLVSHDSTGISLTFSNTTGSH